MPGAVEHRGGLDRTEWSAPGRRIKVVAVRRVPAVRVECLDWTLVGGRRQLLRLRGVDVRSCNQQRWHRGWRRPFPRRGAKVGVDADTGGASRRDILGGLIHEDHAVTA
jgi:hypothetical protein